MTPRGTVQDKRPHIRIRQGMIQRGREEVQVTQRKDELVQVNIPETNIAIQGLFRGFGIPELSESRDSAGLLYKQPSSPPEDPGC